MHFWSRLPQFLCKHKLPSGTGAGSADVSAEGRQEDPSKWHEDNLLGPGRKMHSDKDRWNEVVARENLKEL